MGDTLQEYRKSIVRMVWSLRFNVAMFFLFGTLMLVTANWLIAFSLPIFAISIVWLARVIPGHKRSYNDMANWRP